MLSEKDRNLLNQMSKNWKPAEVAKQIEKTQTVHVKGCGKRKIFIYKHEPELAFFIGKNRYGIAGDRILSDNRMPVHKKQGKWTC